MTSPRLLAVALSSIVVLVLTAVTVAHAETDSPPTASVADCGAHWIDAWMAAAQESTASVVPRTPAGGQELHTFTDQTLRMVVTPEASGDSIRVTFSNQFGTEQLRLADVHVGIADGASVVEGTDRQLLFDGSTDATIPPGGTIQSDPIALSVVAFVPLAITYYVPDASSLDIHLEAKQAEFATPPHSGDHANESSGDSYTETLGSVLAVNSLEVQVPTQETSVVAIGDSLTDGVGSTDNVNARWTDDLNRRLQQTSQDFVVVVNAGISGNQLASDNVGLNGTGRSTAHRFEQDALDQPGVGTVIVYAGINDLLAPKSDDPATAVIDSYLAMIDQAHRAGVRILGTTLTPAGKDGALEAERQAINQWIRTSGAFDGVIDLDAAVRSPSDPSRIVAGLTTDSLHFNDAGYQLLADTVDTTLFASRLATTNCAQP